MTEHNCDDGLHDGIETVVDQLIEAFCAAATSRYEATLELLPPPENQRAAADAIARSVMSDTIGGVIEVLTDLDWMRDAIRDHARIVANVVRAEQCTDTCRDEALDDIRAARYVAMRVTGHLAEGDEPTPIELEIAPRPFLDHQEYNGPYAAIAHCEHNVHYWVRPTPAQVARWEATS